MDRIVLVATATLSATPVIAQESFSVTGSDGSTIVATVADSFEAGWAIATLPDGRMLVTEKEGRLILVSADGRRLGEIANIPETQDNAQGGLGDVILHPGFEENATIYLSPVEWDGPMSGAVIYRARLDLQGNGGALSDVTRIWEQVPKHDDVRHYSQRLAFGPDGFLYVTSGERQLEALAQDRSNNLGAILRLTEAGAPAPGNPFEDDGGVSAQIWTYGHRNPLGLAFTEDGTLWAHEMGPRHGDELNIIEAGANYGWPLRSFGDDYSGREIPDHDENDGFALPAIAWVPAVSPAGLAIYGGDLFTGWSGDALLGGLSSMAFIRVSVEDGVGREVARYSWDERIREVEEAPDGSLWVLEDGYGGRLLRLTPAG
ncbi:PQQ-dependent sugar dehydrogenase [Pontivivens ytuae]|uniref:PQQ-dependent sugar dehydrogenase n=1 Tax=Pontivivens ytuae TaxID=2789856 RepID=A0A7S9LU52_9RHOB|nr:PQQ-dependent sugar dehydrogenase [Pontivivens ytuae]QPH54795.1 PQQ-dependent sugar dehydrogenase [Pontivivens ytuae]